MKKDDDKYGKKYKNTHENTALVLKVLLYILGDFKWVSEIETDFHFSYK